MKPIPLAIQTCYPEVIWESDPLPVRLVLMNSDGG